MKDILIRINLCYYFKKLLYLPQKYISTHTSKAMKYG